MDNAPAVKPAAKGPIGLALAIIGLVLVLIGTFAVPWGKVFFGISVSYMDLMDTANQTRSRSRNELMVTYFGWLGLVLLVAVGILAIVACLPARPGQNRAGPRTVCGLVAGLAIIMLIAAASQLGDVMRVQAGPWLTGIGYVLILAATLVGPSRAALTQRG